MSADGVIITPELEQRIEKLFADLGITVPSGRAFAQAAFQRGIGLVDADRRSALIDMEVYAGALYRGRRWRAIAEARQCPRCEGQAETVERRLP